MKNINHKLCQFIVKKCINGQINWAKEIKIAQRLIKRYKDYNFWHNLSDIKLPSLAWFLTDNGKRFLELQIKIQSLEETFKDFSIPIGEYKIGEDKNTCQKPKTLIQFIRLWEENQKKKIQG